MAQGGEDMSSEKIRGGKLPADTTGERITDLREEKHMTQKELAEKIGIDPATQSRNENIEEKAIADNDVKKYAAAFDTTPSYILMDTDFPDKKNYEVEQLGLTYGAVRNLCSQRFNMEVLNRLLEDPLFADLTKMIYVDSLVNSRLSRDVHDETVDAADDLFNGLIADYPESSTGIREQYSMLRQSLIDNGRSSDTKIQDLFAEIRDDMKKDINDRNRETDKATTAMVHELYRANAYVNYKKRRMNKDMSSRSFARAIVKEIIKKGRLPMTDKLAEELADVVMGITELKVDENSAGRSGKSGSKR